MTNFLIAIAAAVVIVPTCVLIALVFYLLSALRIVKRKTIERDKNLEKRLKSATILMKSTYQEIQEHGLDFDLKGPTEQWKELMSVVVSIDSLIDANTD